MTLYEGILIGTIVAMFSALVGVAIGKHGRVTQIHCDEIRQSCNKLICTELGHIKHEQEEMKKDIKIILKSIKVN